MDMDASTQRTVVKIVLITIVAWVFLTLTASSPSKDKFETPEYPAQVQKASYGHHHKAITLYGRVSALNPINIDAQVTAPFKSIDVVNGQAIQQGQLIAQLDTKDFDIQRASLSRDIDNIDQQILSQTNEADALDEVIARDKSLLDNAQDLLDRYQNLSDKFKSQQGINQRQDTVSQRAKTHKNSITQQTSLRHKVEQLKLTRQQKELALTDNLQDIKHCTIRSPITGIISNFDHDIGDYIQTSQAICMVFDPNKTYIHAFIPSQYYSQLTNGLSAHLKDHRDITLSLHQFDQVIDEQSAHLDAKFYFDVEEKTLYPIGQMTSLSMNIPTNIMTIKVPESSIYETNFVYTVKDHILQKTKVAIIGQYADHETTGYLITSPDIHDNDQILVTRLPWPKSGLRVSHE